MTPPRRTGNMKLSCLVVAAAVGAVGILNAQDVDVKSKSKTRVFVEDGKTMTVTGCVQRSAEGFSLTNVAGAEGALRSYILAVYENDDDGYEDLEKHVGHRVEITGKAADKGDGKLKVETKSEVKDKGDTKKVESKSEVKGDLATLPFLGVKSLRMIATACP
jgi:hypothetical protein